MNETLLQSLRQVCARVNTDRVERKLYSHDVAVFPSLVKPLLGQPLAEAVCQPQSEQELVQIVKWADQNHLPLTPRGKASSGYGGVLPVRQGVVVDFYFMKSVLHLDPEALTVTVQPGIAWEQLDRYLQPRGLTLRLYPSSYPASTVGGWLAQGGAGFGSYQYGYFRQNVVSAQVVLPNGQTRTFSGEALDLISEAEGITGLLSQVTLRVMPNDPIEVISLGIPTATNLQQLVQALIAAELPIWSMVFINPKMAELKNRMPHVYRHDIPEPEPVELPSLYILTLVCLKANGEAVRQALTSLAPQHHAQWLSDRIAQHEWANRFNLMIVKRLGPSLVPSEIVVPVANLAPALDEIGAKVTQPIVKEGVIVRGGNNGQPEAVVLGFIPADERQFTYNFVFALSLSVIQIAEKHGGRAYSTGLYFAQKAGQVLGQERLARLRQFKAEVDPNHILNPGKVLEPGLMGAFIGLAGAFEPVTRMFGNTVGVTLAEKADREIRRLPKETVWYTYACSQCGYCVDECEQFYGRGWESQSPRGKWFWLREYMEGREQWSQKQVDTFLSCTTCEMCNLRCSAALPIEPTWMELRGKLVNTDKRMTFPAFEMMNEAVLAEGDIWAGYRRNRSDWFPEDLKARHGPEHKSKTVYFAGCTASYVEHDIGVGTVRLLDAAGVDFTYLAEKESCCATPALVSGKWDTFARTLKANVQAVKEAGADTVIASCPACDMMWRQVYPAWAKKLGLAFDIKVKHYSEVIAEKITSGELTFPANDLPPQTVTWHDSCHIGRASGVYEPPRTVIRAIPNVNLVEMAHNRDKSHCCGSVITLVKEPPTAHDLGVSRLNEALEVGAQKVLALCPCCQFQLRVSAHKRHVPVEVCDLAALAAKALGVPDLPDPHPEVVAQWAVFEAMIALMTPQGFAALMGTMWPELIEAMPLGMGGMMRFMGQRLPFMLEAMKPMFPILFPVLLPMMMPKVMPTMLKRVGEQIPMPAYMAEQMPDLMPKVMDSLMPHMIAELVPLVTGPMVEHLKKPRNS